jgi:hypothetical protein
MNEELGESELPDHRCPSNEIPSTYFQIELEGSR